MSRLTGVITLTIFSLCPFLVFGQNQDSINTSHEARRLYISAVKLFQSSNYSEAYDTLYLSIEYRKRLYGELSLELGRPYNLFGIICRNLGKLNESLNSYQLAEKCYLPYNNKEFSQLASIYNGMGNIYIDNFMSNLFYIIKKIQAIKVKILKV